MIWTRDAVVIIKRWRAARRQEMRARGIIPPHQWEVFPLRAKPVRYPHGLHPRAESPETVTRKRYSLFTERLQKLFQNIVLWHHRIKTNAQNPTFRSSPSASGGEDRIGERAKWQNDHTVRVGVSKGLSRDSVETRTLRCPGRIFYNLATIPKRRLTCQA
jgi:hypothetical protein